ncbi:hypothetical protein RB195_019680 [Necator americanus]|uniref:Uncharacterized protein n=1 Tax=Necator americanus TaxID=51031 RepID=A0ABR1CHU9_NECAM
MNPSNQKLYNKILLLLLFLPFQFTNAVQKSSRVLCADYLRCRNDELEERWRCNEASRRVVADVCRVERHLRSIKRLTLKRERNFAVCVAETASELDAFSEFPLASCEDITRESYSRNDSQCDFHDDPYVSRCAALKRCCIAVSSCEKRVQYAAMSSMVSMQRTAAETLLKACRSDMNAVVVANVTKSDQIMAATAVNAASAALELISALDSGFYSASQSQIQAHDRHTLESKPLKTTRRHPDIPATPLLPLSQNSTLLQRIDSMSQRTTELTANSNPPNLYRSRSYLLSKQRLNGTTDNLGRSRAYGFPTKQPASFGASSRLIEAVDSETMRRPKSSLLQDGTATVNKKMRNRGSLFSKHGLLGNADKSDSSKSSVQPSYNVDVIIERETHIPIDVIIDRSQNPSPFSPHFAEDFAKGPALQPLKSAESETTLPTTISTLPPLGSSSPSLGTLNPLPPAISQKRPTIRRPWSNRYKWIKRGRKIWKGSSLPKSGSLNVRQKLRKKHGITKRRRVTRTRVRPIGDFSAKFPNDTDTLTDIAVPMQNRLTNSKKQLLDSLNEFNRELMALGRNISNNSRNAKPLARVFTPQHRASLKTEEDAIYEDILEQERKALIARNIIVPPEDFDDVWDPPTASTTASTPSFFLNDKQSTVVTSTFSSGKTRPHKRKIRKRMRKVLISTPIRTTPSPTTRDAASLLTSTDDPLDGPIVETSLSNQEGSKLAVKKEELEQVIDGKHETLVVFESVATSEPLGPKLNWNFDFKVPSEDPLFAPSFSTVPLPTEDSFEATTTETIDISAKSVTDFSASSSRPTNPPMQLGSVDQTATIIPTLRHADWTAPPNDNKFSAGIIPLIEMNSVFEGPFMVLDKQADNSESSGVGEMQTTVSPSITTTPQLVAQLLSREKKVQARGTKLTETEEPLEISMPNGDSSSSENQAISVLKLPETTLRLSHCEVYSLCLDEMSRQEAECQNEDKKAGRMMPNFLKRRRGLCSRRLVSTYQNIDVESKNLEESYGSCIRSRLGQKITEVEPSKCSANSLPSKLGSEPCHSKVHVIKNHCAKLAQCCPDAEVCRNEVNRSEAARALRRRKESLALATSRCQIWSYRDYRKRVKQRMQRRAIVH